VGSQRAVSSRMEAFAKALKQDPQFDGILRERGRQLGIIEDSRLDRVVRARKIDRALTHSIGIEQGSRVNERADASITTIPKRHLSRWKPAAAPTSLEQMTRHEQLDDPTATER
jgi:hypothetical protein